MDNFRVALVTNFESGAVVPRNRRILVEVALIDEGRLDQVRPLAYFLKEEVAEKIKEGQLELAELEKGDLLVLAGEIEKLDRDQKVISLSNGNTISYRHLVLIKGQGEEVAARFTPGIQTLTEALKLRQRQFKFSQEFAHEPKEYRGAKLQNKDKAVEQAKKVLDNASKRPKEGPKSGEGPVFEIQL